MKGKPFHYNQQKPQQLFATGMNGDEDLGEDIIMKGKPFHYDQRPANEKLFATGMNGDEDLGEDIIMKGKPFHYNQQSNDDKNRWVELPDCKGGAGEKPLMEFQENASWANCKVNHH